MNKAKVLELADTIEKHMNQQLGIESALLGERVGFNMNFYIHRAASPLYDRIDECKTVACLAGWVVLMEGHLPENYYYGLKNSTVKKAKKILGLSDDEAVALFHPHHVGLLHIPPAAAIHVLRKFAETGKIDWLAAVDAIREN